MSPLIRPNPFPDELDRSYLGRVLAINGLGEGKDAIAAFVRCQSLAGESTDNANIIELLGSVAGVSTEQFFRAHSLLPLRRAITNYYGDLEHGSLQRKSLLRLGDHAMLRPGAYLCEHCVAKDIVGYWHRSHQVIGQVWCPEHKVPLRYVADPNAFSRSPYAALDSSVPLPDLLVMEAIKSPEVNRFLSIAERLLHAKKALSVKYISYALRDAANQRGLRTVRGCITRPLLSDFVRQRFPHDWLTSVCDDLIQKAPGVLHKQLDETLFQSGANASIETYLMAAAVLFDSAEQAIQSLEHACNGGHVSTRAPRYYQFGIDNKALREAYVSEGGHLKNIARRLNLPRKKAEKLLKSQGMPNLNKNTRKGKDYQTSADAFFNLGRSVTESAAIGGLTIPEMESLIRSAGTKFAETLVDLRQARSKCRTRERAKVARGGSEPSQSTIEAVVASKGVLSAADAKNGNHSTPRTGARRVAPRSYVLEPLVQN
jgi:TniQ